jgi:3-deoxy-D-manno-octulosonic-acid transferase
MPLLTDLGTALWSMTAKAVAPFNAKADAWVKGRRGLFDRLEQRAGDLRGCLWMHCASVGEFEQGLPILEAIKREQPDLPVLLTFFSSSGYEARKDHPLATHVDHLPLAGRREAERLVHLIQPKAVLWVKYEFWYHILHALKNAAVPTFLVSAIFRPEQAFFRWYGAEWRAMLHCFTQVFVQDERSLALLHSIGVKTASVSGDTRFDRVSAIVDQQQVLPLALAFHRAMDAPVLIAGSTWPADEVIIAEALGRMSTPPRMIIVPHEPTAKAVEQVMAQMPAPAERWSTLDSGHHEGAQPRSPMDRSAPDSDPLYARTLVMDATGLLARAYQHADMAYVGGGFGDGIHSLLEAAAWGVPVIFGPRHTKFAEAQGLIDADAGVEVRNAEDLARVLTRWTREPDVRRLAGLSAQHYVADRVGATERILPALREALR